MSSFTLSSPIDRSVYFRLLQQQNKNQDGCKIWLNSRLHTTPKSTVATVRWIINYKTLNAKSVRWRGAFWCKQGLGGALSLNVTSLLNKFNLIKYVFLPLVVLILSGKLICSIGYNIHRIKGFFYAGFCNKSCLSKSNCHHWFIFLHTHGYMFFIFIYNVGYF